MAEGVIPLDGFLVFLWVSTATMTVVFLARGYIRWVCFGALLAEDWLVAAALAIFIGMSATHQVYLKHMYELMNYYEGKWVPGPTFMEDQKHTLRAIGGLSIAVNVGLWLIKASFLVLFYRLGHQVPVYLYTWWALAVFVMACGVASIAANRYDCLFGDINDMVAMCLNTDAFRDFFGREIAASVLDIVSDLVLVIFPVWILWRTRFSLRQKIVFSGIFCLVGVTIGVAISRGVHSQALIQDPKYAVRQINVRWIFWFAVEYVTSFMVACAISFRSLFVEHRNKLSAAGEREVKKRTPPSSVQNKHVRYYLDKMSATLVSTAHFLEGHGYDHDTWKLPMPTSGLMTVDFSQDENWRGRLESGTDDAEPLKTFSHGGKWDTHTTATVSSTGTAV